MDKIIVKGARENNLKNVDIELPKNKLIVMTGLSGSGKSSLAFDTIYEEGRRRYVESLSAYARQFLGGTEKPDVDSIEGLSPTISIDQKTTNKNPRSTVGTVTEIYDYFRLLFARIGIPYCPIHHKPVQAQSVEEMVNQILTLPENSKIMVLSPIIEGEKGSHKAELDKLRKDGFTRVRINGELYDLSEEIELEKNKRDTIEVVVDRLIMKEGIRGRLHEAIELATKLANGRVVIDHVGHEEIKMSEQYACNECDFSLPELSPRLFSFNSPYGACPDCKGLGIKMEMDVDLVIPDKSLSINEGSIKAFSGFDLENIHYKKLQIVCEAYGIDPDKPIKEYTKKELNTILYGSDKMIRFQYRSKSGNQFDQTDYYEGVINNLKRRYHETKSEWIRDWIEQYMYEAPCETCQGKRLSEGVLSVQIQQKNIYDLTAMSIKELVDWFQQLELNEEQKHISNLIVVEIKQRLDFLKNVGLEYLTLNRMAGTLSGGEAQRIRLATQIGSKLTGVLYVLDEPSIGLHQRDNQKLINSLMEMRDLGNTLIVVEHDEETMRQADYLVDIGPYAGEHGGQIVAQGTPEEVMKNEDSITGNYLSGRMKIEVPKKRRKGNRKNLEVVGASENNLKNITVKFPLGKFVCVTGVSGSGKSTLVNEILYKAVACNLYSCKDRPGKHKKIKGLEHVDKVIDISQDPIGRTPRSNPATYTGVMDDIRDLFTLTKEAKIRGYNKSRFSFNVKGGRCEACRGDGVKKIEMHFLPDVYVPCSVCHGTRYNSETLEVKYKGKNIAEVLDMRVEEAVTFFDSVVKIRNKLQMLVEVGLGYIRLGQSAPTLSGGEAARVKLAKELQRRATGKSLFILDEPTTGLHTDDVKRLLDVLYRIVDNGDTVVVIEHNLDVIKVADYIIDMGPEGGDLGGTVVVTGTPEEIAQCDGSYTGQFLKEVL